MADEPAETAPNDTLALPAPNRPAPERDAPMTAADPLYPYPPGHPNLMPVDAKTPADVATGEKSVAAGIGSSVVPIGISDVISAPLSAPPVDPGTSTTTMMSTQAGIDADYNHVRVVAGELIVAVRGFRHEVDQSTDLGKLVAFVRMEFGA